ncbi:MAG: DHA2 family efflux MFS transporter permease subunit [Rhizobiales bacterium]|nr:DHA2 family efflux MFS transporter permease subunit [Hyphomicrobiales bacterium]MBI3674936.1 DHA2 family efflux MFS transporter permease subunit [Hyphomicrobiales bacterium]
MSRVAAIDPAYPPPATLGLWFGYAAMCLGMFMAILDIQIVVTSLPVIQDALRIGAERMSWVQTSYLIAEVIAIPLTGLLTRIFSLRFLFAGAVAAFTLASIASAASVGFASLIVARVLQGLAGGVLIPLVFSAIFLLFPRGFQQTLATTMGGVLAVLAPALGPISGGLLTENFSWHWLFLINVIPGIVTCAAGLSFLPRQTLGLGLLRLLDWISLFYIAVALAAFELALKDAPKLGWSSPTVVMLFASFAGLMVLAVRRPRPVVDFDLLKDRNLAFGCGVSFLLGVGLFGSVYLMPVFLAFVRGHGPVEIGLVILVTGIAQLVTAPIAVQLDRRFPARPLAAIGFAGFAIGMAMSTTQTVNTDYDGMFWPQVVRGGVVALCILPPTRFALGFLPLDKVSDASGLYNLSRNLGGAIGIALVDTVMFSRQETYADWLKDLMKSDPAAAAPLMGLKLDEIPAPGDAMGFISVMDSVQGASLTMAINDAWAMLAGITALALVLLWVMGPIRPGALSAAGQPDGE